MDRRRILTQIFKEGLNLVVLASVFEEQSDLKQRFAKMNGSYKSKMLYNTLNPVFSESFQVPVQMDTQIFEYLKNKRAVFEIRHYIIERNLMGAETSRSELTEEDEKDLMSENDYITLGYVRVPLLHLITKNNGIDGDFVIFDDYKQQMGSLKLRISLNHHSNQRPLYSETAAKTVTAV